MSDDRPEIAKQTQPDGHERRNLELKARDRDPARSLGICLKLGASDRGLLLQRDTYFVVGHGRLKLREQQHLAELIFYERVDETAARESRFQIVAVEHPDELRKALSDALGVLVVVKKQRRLLMWRHVRIHLDEVEDLGCFLEFEALSEAGSDLSVEHERISELSEALGLTDEDLIACSYSDQLLALSD